MSDGELVSLVCCDLGAIVRGRALLAAELEAQLASGVSWVPANHALTPAGSLADPNPFGSTGDLRLLPDALTHARIEARADYPAGAGGGSTPLELVLCDIVEIDGRPWECCPRLFLRRAVQELERDCGARLLASFEHEFQLLSPEPPALAFSLDAQRRAEPFAELLMDALLQAGVEPERFLPEYAPHQFEIPLAPAAGVAAADRAVTFREVVREVARREGMKATFTPLLDPQQAGNGVHIHISLLDASGAPLLYDADRPGALSELGGSFAAGILAHAAALSALSAPSPVSAERLTPHHWSAGAVCLAVQNREALLRIPPLVSLAGSTPERQMRVEYRGADASANPYLALGAIVRAGLEGVRAGLPAPPLLECDPAALAPAEAERFGVGALPRTLEDALAALTRDETARGWFPALLLDAYVAVKRSEIAAVAGLDLEQTCGRYGAIY